MYRPPLSPGNTPGTHFSQRLSQPQGYRANRRIMSLKNSNDTIGNRTHNQPVCSVVLQPLGHCAPLLKTLWHIKIRQNCTTQCIQQALENGKYFRNLTFSQFWTALLPLYMQSSQTETKKERQVAADTLQQGASSRACWPISVTWLKCLLMCGSVSCTTISVLQKYLSISPQNLSLTSLCSCISDQKSIFSFNTNINAPKVQSGHLSRSTRFKQTLLPDNKLLPRVKTQS